MRILYLFILSITFSSWGQINNHWKLGQTDLNFTNTTPVANVVANGNYGKANISDPVGNLLFYTDGVTVWNKNHNVMTNGNELLNESTSSIINTIIVPNPGNSSQYYIFTSYSPACLCFLTNPANYVYSIVEINTTNPLGIVLDIGNTDLSTTLTTYTKYLKDSNNSKIENNLNYGPLTITKNNLNNEYWLIAQSKNKLLSYKINNSGLNLTPIESNFTNNQIYSPGTQNTSTGTITGNVTSKIKVSSDNQYLVGMQKQAVLVNDPPQNTGYFYRISFDGSTGLFTNYQQFYGGMNIKDFELASNSNILYYIRRVCTVPSLIQKEGEILVKDLINLSTNPRLLNENAASTASSKFSYLQKDRQGNLLISSDFTDLNKNKYVHRISNQNSFASSYVETNFVYLNNYTINVLPQVIHELVPLPTCSLTPLTLNTETNTGSIVYDNYRNITTQSNYIVNLSSQDISLKAKDYIILKPNTQIKTGSKFHAKIQPCNLIQTGRYSNLDEDIKDNTAISIDSNNIKMYPNPSNSIVTFNSIKERINKITIVSLDGKQVINQLVNNLNEYQLNVSNLENGIYLVNIETKEGKTHTQKLIKN
jgi:hypothetical protein